MSRTIAVHIWGDLALFTRPEMKVERVSYDAITPSAARGVLEAIYWKPQIRWVVERLHVLNRIQFTNLRRNEVASKIPAGTVAKAMKGGDAPLGLYIEEDRQQRASLLLRNVAYVIEARFEVLDHSEPPQKHLEMFKRRAQKGQYFHHPYFGCREFPCDFAWIEGELPPSAYAGAGRRDLGYMLHDIDYTDQMTPRFFHAEMVDGVIVVPPFPYSEVTQ